MYVCMYVCMYVKSVFANAHVNWNAGGFNDQLAPVGQPTTAGHFSPIFPKTGQQQQ